LVWTEKVVKGLRGINPELETCYDEELARGRNKHYIYPEILASIQGYKEEKLWSKS
jgi:hypothetical protein